MAETKMAEQKKIQNEDLDSVLSFFQDDGIEPFDVDYQNRFLNVFITDKDGFPERIIDVVHVDYFDSYQKILLDYGLKFYNQYREVARFSTLKDIITEKEKGLNRDHLLGLLEKIKNIKVDNIEHVKRLSHKYFKERSVKNCLFELVSQWKKHDYDSMKSLLENALKAGEPKDTGHDYVRDVEKRLLKDFREPVPTLPVLDKYIGGGLSGGELGIVLAPPGGGKSMMLVKFGCAALLAGKKVLYYTFELSEKVVGQRFDACINQIKIKDVWDFPDVIREKADIIHENGGSLVIKEFPTGQASINTIMAHLRTLETNEGFKPDVIFVDYADIMKPLSSYSDKRHALTEIYESLRGLAVEYHIPLWTASQTNRLGMDQEKFTLSVIGESLGKAATADVVIGLGRTPEDKEAQKGTLGILKNRNGQDGFYREIIFDTSRIFIDMLDIDPATIIGPKDKQKDKSTNKKHEKSVDDEEKDMNSIFETL